MNQENLEAVKRIVDKHWIDWFGEDMDSFVEYDGSASALATEILNSLVIDFRDVQKIIKDHTGKNGYDLAKAISQADIIKVKDNKR